MNLSSIFLASTGRSGSTAAMKALSLHPQVLVRSVFPYETRAAQYEYVKLLNEYEISGSLNHGGANYLPCQKNDANSVEWIKRKNLAICESNIQDYYAYIKQEEGKPLTTHFAEKLIGLSLAKSLADYQAINKIIFIKRDPRDSFLSMKSFDGKKKGISFQGDKSDEKVFEELIEYYIKVGKFSKHIKERSVFLKYENLLADPGNTLYQLFEDLDLDCNENLIGKITDEFTQTSGLEKKHRTTSGSESTIGRWQQEADEVMLSLFEKFSNEIVSLGYS